MFLKSSSEAVSYTHLDVYKRQILWKREIVEGQAAVEDENSITSVIFGSGKRY